MISGVAYTALLVDDYERAKDFYCNKLGFVMIEDTLLPGGKRWMRLQAPGGQGSEILLSRAVNDEQRAVIGNQAGGRVLFFLHTNNFEHDYAAFRSAGIEFTEGPFDHDYGRVAVFKDLYGNRIDLIQPKASVIEYRQGHYTISTSRDRLDVDAVHAMLNRSHWATRRTRETVVKSIANSLCYGVYDDRNGAQIGFARVVTDYCTFAYLCDVFIDEGNRGNGLSKWLMNCILQHPELQSLRRFMLATKDAHSLYTRFGFRTGDAKKVMEILKEDP